MAVAYLIIPVQPALQTAAALCGRPGVPPLSLAGLGGLLSPTIPTVPTDVRRSRGISLPAGKSPAVGSTPLPLLLLPAGLGVAQQTVTSLGVETSPAVVTSPAIAGKQSCPAIPTPGTNAITGKLVLALDISEIETLLKEV